MPIEKLTRKQMQEQAYPRSGGYEPYVEGLKSLRAGEGGRITVEDEGVSRQSVKNRLKKSADVAGVKIKFRRSAQDVVIFEVLGAQ